MSPRFVKFWDPLAVPSPIEASEAYWTALREAMEREVSDPVIGHSEGEIELAPAKKQAPTATWDPDDDRPY